jgi:hypothetical protein
MDQAAQQGEPPVQVDLRTGQAHSARIYDVLLGGKDNYAPDREAAAAIVEAAPNLPTSVRANRRFMTRTAHYLAADLGIRQFLDVGTGLPTSPNLHEVVQDVAPESRVIYVDNDPIVLVHARALLTSKPEGRTAYLDADIHHPEAILASAQVQQTFDLSRPIAVSLLAILQFVLDDDEAQRIIKHLMDPLVPGSVLALSTVTTDGSPAEASRGVSSYNSSGVPARSRTKAEVEALFEGLDLLDPGVVLVHRWRPDEQDRAIRDDQVFMYGAIAVKP